MEGAIQVSMFIFELHLIKLLIVTLALAIENYEVLSAIKFNSFCGMNHRTALRHTDAF